MELIREEGGHVEILDGVLYEPADPWSRFVRCLWSARQLADNGTAAHSGFAIKRIANALIGRSAATGRQWLDCPGTRHPLSFDLWYDGTDSRGKPVRYRAIAGRVQREHITPEHPESMPALAAWVYSLARVRLWKWMRTAGLENVYYVDTDSLWTNRAGYSQLEKAGAIRPGQLGFLRLVGKHEWAEFRGIKYYETPSGVLCAGVPIDRAEAQLDGYSFWCPETMSLALQAHRAPAERLVRHNVPFRRPYRHGTVGKDGEVFPLEV